MGSMDSIIGWVLIGLGVVLGVGAVWAARLKRPLRRAAANPLGYLHTATNIQVVDFRPGIGVSGRVITAPTLRAPLTERPCLAWVVSVLREDRGAEDYPEWNAVWWRQRVQDIEVAYDLRWDVDGREPLPERPAFVPRPGTVWLEGDRIDIKTFDGTTAELAVDQVGLPPLVELGVPPELRHEIAADVRRYRLSEGCLNPGAFVRCAQEDADARFMLLTGSYEQQGADLMGCLLWGFVVGALLALLVGLLLIFGEPPGDAVDPEAIRLLPSALILTPPGQDVAPPKSSNHRGLVVPDHLGVSRGPRR